MERIEDIDLNALQTSDDIEYTAFSVACKNGHKYVVQLLLDSKDKNIDFNATNTEGYTAFWIDCWYGHKDVVKLFLDCSEEISIDLNGKDEYGRTTFMIACYAGHKDAVQLGSSKYIYGIQSRRISTV